MTAADLPRAAIVEIYERHRNGEPMPEVGPGSVIVPNEVRINGVPVYCPEDCPPVVERIDMDQRGVVRVTLTLWARRVVIDDAPAEPSGYDNGGALSPGLTRAHNSTGTDEPVPAEPPRSPLIMGGGNIKGIAQPRK